MAIMLMGSSVSGLIGGRSGEPPSECMIAAVCGTRCARLCDVCSCGDDYVRSFVRVCVCVFVY